MSKPAKRTKSASPGATPDYTCLVSGVSRLLEAARRASVRTVNAFMTATYWEVGRRIVEFEQGGEKRAEYGDTLLERLSKDLTSRYGRGFARPNLIRFRQFYHAFPAPMIRSTLSSESSATLHPIRSTLSNESGETAMMEPSSPPFSLADLAGAFPLPWSHYVMLISRSRSHEALAFYQTEALRGGWSVRQLARQIDSQFYERTALSRNKAAMLTKGGKATPEDALTPDEEIRDPLVLEFLNLRDEYSETDLEDALIRHLETFLMELGGDFAFIGRQRRLRIGSEWYRVDLLFFHRRLRCLVVIDLKLGKFTHADAGQMHLYLNYAREHWTHEGENPPVGLILCAEKDESVAKYALENLGSKVLAREYQMLLPNEKLLAAELDKTRHQLASSR